MAHCSLYHPHVLKFYDVNTACRRQLLSHRMLQVFLSAESIHIIFENPSGRNLLSMLQKNKLREDQARHLFQQITFAVAYYHSMVHHSSERNSMFSHTLFAFQNLSGLDLELENIFLDTSTGIIKMIDFGFWKTESRGQLRSLAYLAPEDLLSSQQDNIQTSRRVRAW